MTKSNSLIKLILLGVFISTSTNLYAQVTVDDEYNPMLEKKAYINGTGPTVCIDNAHGNYHTLEGSFAPFGRLLKADGYEVVSYSDEFEEQKLNDCRVLAIVNPLHPSDQGEWVLPNPSAFTNTEIDEVNSWVKNGGRLLLIADHMPFAGAAADLAESFGYEFLNGFEQKDGNHWPPAVFSIDDNTLIEGEITSGLDNSDEITSVASFTGSALKAPNNATKLLQFPSEYYALMPDTAWRFKDDTPRKELDGWSQGAYQNYGNGKIVVLGEAGMLTAQVVNNFKMGMSSPRAPQNEQLALNIVHWLDDVKGYVSVKDLIANLNKELGDIFNSGERYERIADYYTEDAIMLGPNNEVVEGKDTIRNYWKTLEGIGTTWELEVLDIEEREDLIIQIGISRLGVMQNGTENIFTTKFLVHWELEDGSYKMAMDFYQQY